MKTLVQWKRLWRPFDGRSKDVNDNDGFLVNSTDLIGFASPDDPKSLNELLDVRCLVLCGEPGMGKSKALEQSRPEIEKKAGHSGGGIYWRSFREAFDPAHLLQGLKTSVQWEQWIKGNELTIVIDGVDEGLALASNLITVFAAQLKNRPVERLRLILVCRDAEWPVEEGRALMSLWPAQDVSRFQLQRLRWSDALDGARHWGLSESEAADFMDRVQKQVLEPFASRPITLEMLVEEFKAHGQLPGSRTEIFKRACLRLCREEPYRSKFLKGAIGFEFKADQLLPVAEKIAALMLLCRFNAVSRSPSAKNTHLDYERLLPPDADALQRAKLDAALNCALFCDAGNQARTFAHQSYLEFLAARYLSNFSLKQLLDLLCVRAGDQRQIVPQLSELAAWLAFENREFCEWLIGSEPEILIRNDTSALTASQRESFVAGLLARLAREEAFDDWNLKRFYGSFRHSGLASQLRPYLQDPNIAPFARRAAIHIADLNKVGELFDDLLAVARNIKIDIHLREQAMNAVCRLVPEDRLSELAPFARCEIGPDPDDNLRGVALKTLVPRFWKVSTAVPFIRKPSNQNVIGDFRGACENYLPQQIETDDLPALLTALAQVEHPFEGHHNHIRPVASQALVSACHHLERTDIASAFLTLLRTKLRQQQLPIGIDATEWKEMVEMEPSKRRQLVDLFIEATGMTVEEIRHLHFQRFIPLKMDDCPWFLERVASATGPRRMLWARLALLFWPSVSDTIYRDEFFHACDELPELATEIGWPCAIALNSPEEKRSRDVLHWQKQIENNTKNTPVKPNADELFNTSFTAARSDWKSWPDLGYELQREDDGRDVFGVNPDPTKKYRWQVCTDVERDQIVQIARDFLIGSPAIKIGSGPEEQAPIHLFWALWLVKDKLGVDQKLRYAIETKWFEALFERPFHGVPEEQALTTLGVGLDLTRATDSLRNRLSRTISGQLGLANVLSGFDLAWRSEFTPVLMDFIVAQKLGGMALGGAIKFLARHDESVARSWLAEQSESATPNDLPTTIALGIGLFPEKLWESGKSKIEAEPPLATAALQALADIHTSSTDFLETLPAVQLGDLFLLLESAFPSSKPIKLSDDEASPRERIEKLRNFIPHRLQALATNEACIQLERLAHTISQWRTSLRWHLRDTRLALQRNNWSGVFLEILIAMAEKHERRWVRSVDDLQELIMDSISRFQENLIQNEFPTFPDLWNEKPNLSPKDEIALTEKIVRWLMADLATKNGAALGCQVEPSRIHETDIEVSARPGGASPTDERFLVTIEVKCSFNQEVADGLEKQLVSEYLLKLGRTHGIYLVGWYQGEGWKPNNNPLKAKTWAEAKNATCELLAGSRKVHPELRIDAYCLNCEFPQAFRKR